MTQSKPAAAPKVGFVSLGCPKALVDSEHILTRLRAEGYEISPSYEGSDLVVINTCGFIDAAVEESLDAIGEALAENGKVIVTGCLGAKDDVVMAAHPQVLAVTGPHATEQVMQEVHKHLPKPHDPFIDLLPPQGIKLTPNHYAYLKISEGCNHRCTFCIIPSLRGDLVSRPIGDVMREAENLVNAGVKELLVVSQDTSAYGVDTKYRTGFWGGRPLRTKLYDLCNALGELGVWVRLHYVPYPSVDDIIPLMAEGKILPYLDVPFQHASPRILKAMKRPASSENNLERIAAGARSAPTSPSAPPSSPASRARPTPISKSSCSSSKRPSSTASAPSPTRRSKAPPPTNSPAPCPRRSAKSAASSSWSSRKTSPPNASNASSAAR
jgi:ribosomal protein S12 methylthiotransferase